LQRELADLQAGRGALLAKLDVPAATEADITAPEEADKSGLIAWMKQGARSVLPNLAREHERALLKEKLGEDTYTAATARVALDVAEEQADVLQRAIEMVTQRLEGAAKLALIEHARPRGAKYAGAIRVGEDTVAPLMGLASIVDDRDFYSSDATIRTLLPSFGLSTIPGDQDAVTGEYGPLHGSTRVTVDARRVSKDPPEGGSPFTITHGAVCDAPTAGHMLCWFRLEPYTVTPAAIPRTLVQVHFHSPVMQRSVVTCAYWRWPESTESITVPSRSRFFGAFGLSADFVALRVRA
jgi:hypothetical protein